MIVMDLLSSMSSAAAFTYDAVFRINVVTISIHIDLFVDVIVTSW